MKIKLSKSQWEKMGKEAGWIKKASLGQAIKSFPARINFYKSGNNAVAMGSTYKGLIMQLEYDINGSQAVLPLNANDQFGGQILADILGVNGLDDVLQPQQQPQQPKA